VGPPFSINWIPEFPETFESAQTVHFTSRQRPTMVLDDRGRRFLYNGASVNPSEYVLSFTLVQEISLPQRTET